MIHAVANICGPCDLTISSLDSVWDSSYRRPPERIPTGWTLERAGLRAAVLVSGMAVGLCTGLTACSSPPEQSGAPAPAAAQSQQGQQKRFDLKGKVVSIDKANKRLTVDHEAIPGFMGAMAMPYPVKDERLLSNLSPGDQVTAKVVSSGGDFWLEEIATVHAAAPK